MLLTPNLAGAWPMELLKDPDFDLVKAGIEPGAAWWQSSALPSEVYYIIGFERLKLEKLWLNNLVVILSDKN